MKLEGAAGNLETGDAPARPLESQPGGAHKAWGAPARASCGDEVPQKHWSGRVLRLYRLRCLLARPSAGPEFLNA